jgi:quinol monooxygenase YgiN
MKMNAKRILIGIALFSTLLGAVATGEKRPQQHIQIAEIEVDPAQLDNYKAAVVEQIEAAVRLEPGVLVVYSVSNKDNPAHVTVFEIYRDREAYLAHLQAPHFLKYKATVEKMVKSLKLIPVTRSCWGRKRNNEATAARSVIPDSATRPQRG